MKILSKIILFAVVFAVMSPKSVLANRSDLAIDAETGTVLYQRNSGISRYPASLTKLMTLYIAFAALKDGVAEMDNKLPVSEHAAKQKKSKMWLKAGTYITLEDAIMSVIIHSANDAATVIAEGIGGSEKQFVMMMNEKARELGMTKTNFKNANGLYDDEQVSTAKDIGTLALAIMRNFPEYYPFFSLKEFTFNGKTYRSNNALLHYRDDIEGMKTGFVSKSGYHLVTVIRKGQNKIISVVMGRRNPRQRDQAAIAVASKAFLALNKEKQAAENGKKTKEREKITVADIGLTKTDAYVIAQNLHNAAMASQTLVNGGTLRIYAENGDFSVQVGTFKSRKTALRNALKTKSFLFAEGSEGADVRTGQIIRKKQKYYTAQITDLNEETAITACRELQESGTPCIVIPPKKRR